MYSRIGLTLRHEEGAEQQEPCVDFRPFDKVLGQGAKLAWQEQLEPVRGPASYPVGKLSHEVRGHSHESVGEILEDPRVLRIRNCLNDGEHVFLCLGSHPS